MDIAIQCLRDTPMATTKQALLGKHIRKARQARGLTLAQLADLARIDAGFLNYIELGSKAPSMQTLYKIAEGLDVAPGQLLVSEAPAPPYRCSVDDAIRHQVRALLAGRSQEEKAELLAVLKTLKDPRRVKALQAVLGR